MRTSCNWTDWSYSLAHAHLSEVLGAVQAAGEMRSEPRPCPELTVPDAVHTDLTAEANLRSLRDNGIAGVKLHPLFQDLSLGERPSSAARWPPCSASGEPS